MVKLIYYKMNCLPNIVPSVSLIPRPIAPPESESKLELRAQAQALVPNYTII